MYDIPVYSAILRSSISLVVKHHIYVADALQIATHNYADCDLFISCDEKLLAVAQIEELKTYNPLKHTNTSDTYFEKPS